MRSQAYLVTHLVFVASSWGGTSWGALPLPRTLFAEEFLFLLGSVSTVMEMNDTELIGEFLHCLRLFQVHENDPHIRVGVKYLLDVEARWCVRTRADLPCRFIFMRCIVLKLDDSLALSRTDTQRIDDTKRRIRFREGQFL